MNAPKQAQGQKLRQSPSKYDWLWPLLLVLFVYIGLALTYSLTTPIFEAPDEGDHFTYAEYIATGHGLPVLEYDQYHGEYHHPPLYYWLVAQVLRQFDRQAYEGYDETFDRNPHAAISDVTTMGNKNVFVHNPEREGWPFHGGALAIRLARLVSIFLGLITVAATYGLGLALFSEHVARRINSHKAWMAAACAAVVALNPQFLYISGVLSNDNAAAAVCSLALWANVSYFQQSRSWHWPVVLGIVGGLSILTKVTALAVVPFILLIILIKVFKQRSIQAMVIDAGVVLGVAALVGGWWPLRNHLLYADPFVWRYTKTWLGSDVESRTLFSVITYFQQMDVSFWGTFGWLNIVWDDKIYTIIRLWTRLSCVGLLVIIARQVVTYKKRVDFGVLALTLGWLGAGMVMFGLAVLSSSGLQGRMFFTLMSAAAVALVAGWIGLWPRRWELAVVYVPVAGLSVLAVLTPILVLHPAYARPAPFEGSDLPPNVTRTNLNYAEYVKLIGYEVEPPDAHPGQIVDVTLYWQVLRSPPGDYTVFVHLFGYDNKRIGALDTYPGLGNYPTSQWQPGYVIRDVYPIRIDPSARVPTLAAISVGWYNFYIREDVPAIDPSGTQTTIIGTFRLLPETWANREPTCPSGVRFGDVINLKGYDVQSVEGGNLGCETADRIVFPQELPDALGITFYWKCGAAPDAYLTVFKHVVDAQGNTVVEIDEPPLGGNYPTYAWSEGQVIQDTQWLKLPSNLPGGTYRVFIGLYQTSTSLRTPAFDQHGNSLGGDAVQVFTFSVDKQGAQK